MAARIVSVLNFTRCLGTRTSRGHGQAYFMPVRHKMVLSSGAENTNYIIARRESSATHGQVDEIESSHYERMIGLTKAEQNKLVKMKPKQPSDPKLMKVAVIGAPNSGKSTLANQLLGWRFTAVSQKVHTTRQKTVGVLTEDNTQIVFLDTPGMITTTRGKRHNLERTLLTDPHYSLYGVDLIVVLVDVSHVWGQSRLDPEVLKALHLHEDKQSVLVLNKVDLMKNKKGLLNVTRNLTEGVVGGRKESQVIEPSKKSIKDWEAIFNSEERKATDESSKPVQESPEEQYQLINPDEGSQEYKQSIQSKSDSEEPLSSPTLSNTCTNSTNCSLEESGSNTSLESTNSLQYNNDLITDTSGHLSFDSHSSDKLDGESLDNEQSNEVVQVWDGISPPDFNNSQVWHQYHSKLCQLNQVVGRKSGWSKFDRVFMVSALDGDGIEDVKDYLLSCAKPAPWIYHPSLITDQDPMEIARLCVWEKLMDHLPQEVPYEVDVRLVMWETDDNDALHAVFNLDCFKKRHIFQCLGKGGATIKKICMEAKQQLMNTFRREMTLKILVQDKTNKSVLR